jgi:hypothetical protein
VEEDLRRQLPHSSISSSTSSVAGTGLRRICASDVDSLLSGGKMTRRRMGWTTCCCWLLGLLGAAGAQSLTPPDPVATLAAAAIDPNTFTLSWEPPVTLGQNVSENATVTAELAFYHVYLDGVLERTTSEASVTMGGLDEYTPYSVGITVENSFGVESSMDSIDIITGIFGSLNLNISGAPSFGEEKTGGGVEKGVSYSVVIFISDLSPGVMGQPGAVITLSTDIGGCSVSTHNETYTTTAEVVIPEGSLIGEAFIRCDTLYGEGDGPTLQLSMAPSDEVRLFSFLSPHALPNNGIGQNLVNINPTPIPFPAGEPTDLI